MIRMSNLAAYQSIADWLRGSRTSQEGLARLEALGITWRRRARPDEIVEALAAHPRAPSMPRLKAMREKAAFLAGVCWALTWTSQLARHMEE